MDGNSLAARVGREDVDGNAVGWEEMVGYAVGDTEGMTEGNFEYDGREVGPSVGDTVGVVAEDEMDGLVGGPLTVRAKGASVCNDSVGAGVAVVEDDDDDGGWAMTNSSGNRLLWAAIMPKEITDNGIILWHGIGLVFVMAELDWRPLSTAAAAAAGTAAQHAT